MRLGLRECPGLRANGLAEAARRDDAPRMPMVVNRGLVYPSDSLETSLSLEVKHSFRSWSTSGLRENCNASFVIVSIRVVGFDIVVTVHR